MAGTADVASAVSGVAGVGDIVTMMPAMILDSAVGRARMGCGAVRWQGATTQWAPAHKEKQRGRRAAARLRRVRSALTPMVNVVVGPNDSAHQRFLVWPSGQLPNLG